MIIHRLIALLVTVPIFTVTKDFFGVLSSTKKMPPSKQEKSCPKCSIRLHPKGMKFINGMSRSYDDDFPAELADLVQDEDFLAAINQINNTLMDYWPCCFCVCCGYACCLCTGGLSLLFPSFCISDAESYVRTLIKRINYRPCFYDKGIEWRLHKKCGRSWIEISYPETSDKPILNSYQTTLTTVSESDSTTEYGSHKSTSV